MLYFRNCDCYKIRAHGSFLMKQKKASKDLTPNISQEPITKIGPGQTYLCLACAFSSQVSIHFVGPGVGIPYICVAHYFLVTQELYLWRA